ncbi:hypothetical protein IWW36_003979, partial [Coemansia brasiliensis]
MSSELDILRKQVLKLEKRLESSNDFREELLLEDAVFAGKALLRQHEELTLLKESKFPNEDIDLPIEIQELNIHSGRDLAADAQSIYETGKLALEKRAIMLQELQNAQNQYKVAKDAYMEFLGHGTPNLRQDSIFGPFKVQEDDGSSSNHQSKTARYSYLFFRSKDLVPLAARFQETCMQNTRVAKCQFDRRPPASGRLEDPFVDQIVSEMAPRLKVILESVVGLRNVSLRKLHKNSGVDIGLTAYSSDYGQLAFFLPIEVKNRFGLEASQSRAPSSNAANFAANRDQLASLCAATGQLKLEALWHALTQTAHYMEHGMPQTNYGVLIAKNAMFLLWRVASERILVSDAVSYTSRDPHPVSMVAFFVTTMLQHPSACLNLAELPPTLYALHSFDERNDSANASQNSGGGEG